MPTRPPASSTSRPQRRWLRVTAVVSVMMFGSLSLQSSSVAQPRPSIPQLAKQVHDLHERAESITEQYNLTRINLKAAQRQAVVAEARVARAQAKLSVEQRRFATIAAAAYRSGSVGGATALMISSSPKDYLDRATALDRISARSADRMRSLRVASVRLAQAKAVAREHAAAVRAIDSTIADKRRQVTALLAQAERALAGLRADERRRVNALLDGDPRASRKEVRLPAYTGPASGRVRIAIDWALSQRGKPYKWGGAGPNSYDCSGLTMMAFRKAGVSLDHYTGSQWRAGRHVSRSELRPGDLVFFYPDHHHVGIYLGNGQMVHAPQTGDAVKVSSIAGRDWAGAVRVIG